MRGRCEPQNMEVLYDKVSNQVNWDNRSSSDGDNIVRNSSYG